MSGKGCRGLAWAGLVIGLVAGCGSSASQSGSGDDGGGTGSSSGNGGSSGGNPSSSSGGSATSSGGGSSGSGSTSSSGGPSGDSGAPPSDASHGPDGAVTYPPLKFSDIGTAALVPGGNQFYFTEGPVWDPAKSVLYFTDINAHQGATVGGAIVQLTLPSTFSVYLQPSGNADGIGLDPQGNIIGAGFASRDAWRLSSSKTIQVLSPCASGGGTCYNMTEINTPDDITSRSDGVLYFTDPTFASGGQGFPTLNLALSNAQGVYRLTKDNVLHLEDSTASGPNGVNLSPDEKTAYVAYTGASLVSKFDVAADGSLSNKKTFASGLSIPDSMCVDAGGNVYVGTSGGLAVYDPTGNHLGTISAGGNIVTNCAFGASDQRTLFITARTSATLVGSPPMGGGLLYQVTNMPVPGIPGQN
jgi:gluconolactonase